MTEDTFGESGDERRIFWSYNEQLFRKRERGIERGERERREKAREM